ncbi:MAG: hypothetical protein O7G30_01160, partial [Proteobacteria bacterium]|nr:hypothetical protein [Pseudomonadota bacterium]
LDPNDRTYYYCAVYDNGSAPSSPVVKRRSTTPPSPFGALTGRCFDLDLSCVDGPNKGVFCGREPEGFCDTAPGAGDGECDACPGRGGVTTQDEMFILLGDQFCSDEELCGGDNGAPF